MIGGSNMRPKIGNRVWIIVEGKAVPAKFSRMGDGKLWLLIRRKHGMAERVWRRPEDVYIDKRSALVKIWRDAEDALHAAEKAELKAFKNAVRADEDA